jgi:cellulose synthase/poly-beta-1,6-N-acetylglucosamine synthase-like glycosyltransferase
MVPQPDWKRFRPVPAAPEDLPRYSIFVALYREASQVRALVTALDALEWPKDRREIFLVCEEDDAETRRAIDALPLPQGFHLVVCPDCQPRTKPKALNHALPLATGKFTVIYDAEDRPHPFQLREACERFSQGGAELACLQAPLAIHNAGDNWLTAMFALEYETLFRGMLPALESMGAPFPLGGTSNHFRTETLRAAGEWDPWNVTEDADLGVRLARLGHRCGTLLLPTMEEAPTRLGVWLRQRTRWLKGWIQTIFVHTRNPAALVRELGWRKTALFHLALSAIVLSALCHPVFLVLLAVELGKLATGHQSSGAEITMLAVAVFNLAAGYTTYAFFAHEIARRNSRRVLPLLFTLPLYWLLISAAGWRAAWQFVFDPFRWEKTEHGLANSGAGAIMEGSVHYTT